MISRRYYYLIELQYLGFRLHGWQHQPKFKTVEGLVKKTLKFVLNKRKLKILGAGRTDAMVSAEAAAFELFLYDQPLEDLEVFLETFNENLPPDIRALDIKEVDSSFNVIQDSKSKIYSYYFSNEPKLHPFAAPLMVNFREELDIELMCTGAKMFEGIHSFHNYCTQPSPEAQFTRRIFKSEIRLNEKYSASFFPETSYEYWVEGPGFLRNQVRLMMGRLIELGRGGISLDKLQQSLSEEVVMKSSYIAPASGLVLTKIHF